ncbi:MAG: hypothetical protein QM751_06830 [Paludibacteraceae bacterium]
MEEKRLKITDWAEEDRPREKLMQKGVSALSDAELLAILIGSGNTRETAVELCRRILHQSHDNLQPIGSIVCCGIVYISRNRRSQKPSPSVSALELGKRRRKRHFLEKKQVKSNVTSLNYPKPY